jgi:hypothetical protein
VQEPRRAPEIVRYCGYVAASLCNGKIDVEVGTEEHGLLARRCARGARKLYLKYTEKEGSLLVRPQGEIKQLLTFQAETMNYHAVHLARIGEAWY